MGATHPIHTAEQVLARVPSLPGGAEVVTQASRRGDVSLVGGAVRDLLLGHWPRELDLTVERDAAGLAQALAASVSPSERAYGHAVEPILHERFGTASVVWEYGRIDVAERRAEVYRAPGALPEVRPGSVEEDLARRDFTVNAIALPLHGAESEGLVSVAGALDDLRAGRLRVLHDLSFRDDPTRILRLARYAARLRFEIEPHTRGLVARAIAAGALDTVSGGRIGAELWLAAREADARAALRALDSLGVLAALGMASPFDDALAQDAEALLPGDGARDILLMAVAFHRADDASVDSTPRLPRVADRLELTREESAAVLAAAGGAAAVAETLLRDIAQGALPSLDGLSPETLALAGALAQRSSERAAGLVREWFAEHRHVRLEIDGGDLLAAGVAEGPEVGARLRRALRLKREGRARGREAELRAALDGELAGGATTETRRP